MCKAAKAASKKAKSSGDKVDHEMAARLNKKASKAAFDQGDAETAKKHADLAKEHQRKVEDLTESSSTASDSDSESNPLLTWASKTDKATR
jgi:hypothetical protein